MTQSLDGAMLSKFVGFFCLNESSEDWLLAPSGQSLWNLTPGHVGREDCSWLAGFQRVHSSLRRRRHLPWRVWQRDSEPALEVL